MKVDHIGDLLIAAPALGLLRTSFPDAHITLICAPWNVGLARRLAIADTVLPLEFFSQNSLHDLDAEALEDQHRAAAAALQELHLPSFDLAIDLRRDEDTRPLLTMVNAKARAGLGDVATFSYLDVAMPYAKHGPAVGMTSLRLGAADLDGRRLHREGPFGLHLVDQRAGIDLQIEADPVWAPSEDGEGDTRLLGAALWKTIVGPNAERGTQVSGRRPDPAREITRDQMTFGPGWADWEPWGRWTTTPCASVRLCFPARQSKIKLTLLVQGHTSPHYPESHVVLRSGAAMVEHIFRAGDEPVDLSLVVEASLSPPCARSDPYLMRGGRYRGTLRLVVCDPLAWQPVSLRIVTGRWRRVIARIVGPDALPSGDRLAIPFELEIIDSSEPIVFEIETPDPDTGLNLAIAGLELERQQDNIATMPVVHMEQQLLDLVALLALRYASPAVPEQISFARRLTRRRPESSASDAVRNLRARRRAGRQNSGFPARLIGLGPGANKETKRWPKRHFVELCRRLLADPRNVIVFVGGPREAADVAEMQHKLNAGERAMDFVASCAVEDFGELAAELDAYIGLDTGTTHFAGRAGVPALAIFGASHDPFEWGPVGEQSIWVSADVLCRDCSLSLLSQCGVGLSCMADLTPDNVWPCVERLLAEADQRPKPGLGWVRDIRAVLHQWGWPSSRGRTSHRTS